MFSHTLWRDRCVPPPPYKLTPLHAPAAVPEEEAPFLHSTPPAPFPRAQYAFIKRVSQPPLEGAVFAKVQLEGCADVADVAVRACKEFPLWGVDAGQVHLFLAAAGGADEPPPDALVAAAADPAKRLGVGLTLARAGITPGCWLLARVPPPAAAAPGAFCCGMPN